MKDTFPLALLTMVTGLDTDGFQTNVQYKRQRNNIYHIKKHLEILYKLSRLYRHTLMYMVEALTVVNRDPLTSGTHLNHSTRTSYCPQVGDRC